LQIYHDGFHARLRETTGDFRIQTTSGGVNALVAKQNAEVEITYAGSTKLATTSTGIDVTGTAVANGFTLENNAEYINVKNSSGAVTRAFGVNAANNLYIGGIDADIGPILFVDNGATLATLGPTGLDVTGSVTADGLSVVAPTGNLEALLESTGGTPSILFKSASGTVNTRIRSGTGGAANLTFDTAGSERARLDASANLLVGTTSDNVANQTGTTQGVRIAGGSVKNIQVASTGTTAYFNRLTTDGSIAEFRKNGSTVGLIGTVNSNIYLGTGDTGIYFNANDDSIYPINTTTIAGRDNGVDLGKSDTRFKDLYLSGSIHSSGNALVGDGTDISMSSTADGQLMLRGNGYTGAIALNANGMHIYNNSASRYISFGINETEEMRLETDGDLHVDGNVVAYSTTVSDIRLKKDIAPIEDAVTKVQQLNGCTFTYLKDDRKSAGLIAQDVEKVLPSAVIEDEAVFHGEEGETYKTVQYDQVIGLLVEAVKELKQEIEELKKG
jgi:hypothetical protein